EARLYVRGSAEVFEGTLTSVSDASVAIARLDGATFTFQTEQLERAEVRASRPNTLRGGIVGGGAGLVVGFVLLLTEDRAGRELGEGFDPWKLVLPPVGGAALGALVGRFVRTQRWAPAFVPLAGGASGDFALAWSISVGG